MVQEEPKIAKRATWLELAFVTTFFHYPLHISTAFNKHCSWLWFLARADDSEPSFLEFMVA